MLILMKLGFSVEILELLKKKTLLLCFYLPYSLAASLATRNISSNLQIHISPAVVNVCKRQKAETGRPLRKHSSCHIQVNQSGFASQTKGSSWVAKPPCAVACQWFASIRMCQAGGYCPSLCLLPLQKNEDVLGGWEDKSMTFTRMNIHQSDRVVAQGYPQG